jgi:7,8-dihydropterin-6-yl-methyl-4-(beta-D-ribofuranosyl)aminobenzene 5'-phosphate synthase
MLKPGRFTILAAAFVFGCFDCAAGARLTAATDGGKRITILVDAFGSQPALRQDWGYSALIEYGGKHVLFDTGNDAAGFEENVRRLGVDLTHLDAVVISHRHGDHTAGLRYLLTVNPAVRIYVPDDEAFGGLTPTAFFQHADPSLPARMRYFNGAVPARVPHGSAWPGVTFIRISDTIELFPGIRLIRNISSSRQFAETPELSLVLDTPKGQVVVVGCSHPGMGKILASVAARDASIFMVVGGLHLVTATKDEVGRMAVSLRDKWAVASIAPGHCTGELMFAELLRVFEKDYRYAGVGSVIDLP